MFTAPPTIILSKSLRNLKEFLKEEHHPESFTKEDYAAVLGLVITKNGAADANLSSLQKYGILEKEKRYAPTPLGKKLLLLNLDLVALTLAAFNPPLFRNLFLQETITHREAITEKLVNKGLSPFTYNMAKAAANCYCNNIEEIAPIIYRQTKTHPKQFIATILQNNPTPPAPPSS